jgi:hypothetical protein
VKDTCLVRDLEMNSVRNPNSREIENVLLIEIRGTIIENDPYNPRAKAPQRRDISLSAQILRFVTD